MEQVTSSLASRTPAKSNVQNSTQQSAGSVTKRWDFELELQMSGKPIAKSRLSNELMTLMVCLRHMWCRAVAYYLLQMSSSPGIVSGHSKSVICVAKVEWSVCFPQERWEFVWMGWDNWGPSRDSEYCSFSCLKTDVDWTRFTPALRSRSRFLFPPTTHMLHPPSNLRHHVFTPTLISTVAVSASISSR